MKKVVTTKMKTIIERPVDIHNEFSYNQLIYKISPTLKQYEVTNYPVYSNGKYNNWTNDCDMDSVILIDTNGEVKFLDQNGLDITKYISQT